MNEIALLGQGQLPVVVDDQLRARVRAERLGLSNLRSHLLNGPVLDAQLHEPHTKRQQPLYPLRTIHDRIDAGELGHISRGMPCRSPAWRESPDPEAPWVPPGERSDPRRRLGRMLSPSAPDGLLV